MTPETPSDPPRRFASARGGRFAYSDEGEGPCWLAVHGLPGSVRDFRWLGAALAGRARLVRLEQPGFGETPLATGPGVRLADRVRFVCEAADALGLERYRVLGHSMGGPVAMGVAAAHADRVDALALLASVGLSPHRLIRRARRHPDLSWLLRSRVVQRALRAPLRAGFARVGFPSSIPDGALVQTMRIVASLRFAPIREAAARVRAPTTIAWAEDDPLVEPAIALSLAAALPPGPRLAFETGGHNIQKSRAVELASILVSGPPV